MQSRMLVVETVSNDANITHSDQVYSIKVGSVTYTSVQLNGTRTRELR